MTESDIQRFWAKVNKDGPIPAHRPDLGQCWLWTAGVCGNGYGGFSLSSNGKKKQIGAHKAAWMVLKQVHEIPVGWQVLHDCDNPLCMRHVYLGTHKDNMHDMAVRGRAATGDRHMSKVHPESVARGSRHGYYTKPESILRGEKHGMAKLTENDVRAIRARHILAAPKNSRIARDYGVTTAMIRFIVRGENWKHVK